MLSYRLRVAVKISRERQYRLARAIAVHPSTLSAWLCGIVDPQRDDPRILELGKLVGVPAEECFEQQESVGK